MSEKNNKRRPQFEYMNTAGHIVTLAEAILEQIGRPGVGPQSPDVPTRIATWPAKPKDVSFRMERYDYDDYTKRYLLEIVDLESSNIFMFRTRGHSEPKLYYIDEDGIETELKSESELSVQNPLLQVLANANKKATKNAEVRTTDREFEKVVGRYILSDLALRPLAKSYEDPSVTQIKAKVYARAFQKRTEDIENEELGKPTPHRRRLEHAVKNKPISDKFMQIDERLLAALAAIELGDEWPNTINLGKQPTE